MKKTQETDPTSPSSDFAELLFAAPPQREVDVHHPTEHSRRSAVQILKLLNYLRPLPLKPNCLLTRHPLLFIFGKESKPIEKFVVRWLSRQLKNHGYLVHCHTEGTQKPGNIESRTGNVHLWTSGLCAVEKELRKLDLNPCSLSYWSNQALSPRLDGFSHVVAYNQLQLTTQDPLGLLHHALGICKSLAEQDYQCCDK